MYQYDCIENLIGVANSCQNQEDIIFFLDNLGISLSNAADIADEKYVTGSNLVTAKIKQAVHFVISQLTMNIYKDDDTSCDIDDLICDNSEKIAEAVYYKAAALMFQELKLGTSRFNEYVKYAEEKVDMNLLLIDSSYELIWFAGGGDGKPPAGLFQKQMRTLEPLKKLIEASCVKECKGARHIITIP